MADMFNFNKNLREIVGKPLKNYGFKQSGSTFTKKINNFEESINISRNRFNLAPHFQFDVSFALSSLNYTSASLFPSAKMASSFSSQQSDFFEDLSEEWIKHLGVFPKGERFPKSGVMGVVPFADICDNLVLLQIGDHL
ncbi:MAG: DUF4304 domain-containing protein [Oscillospiraceae bacterium]|jgi:hypothetical protein|nr:DUF4304 domain-containing protein [Oscillospiraceae bacterium]